jgi:hypothetical protein
MAWDMKLNFHRSDHGIAFPFLVFGFIVGYLHYMCGIAGIIQSNFSYSKYRK